MTIPLTPVAADPRIVMSERIKLRRAQTKNADWRNRCGTCTYAYRNELGQVMCGKGVLGDGHVIDSPFEEGCTKTWQPRREFQPLVSGNPQLNKEFAKRVRVMELATKGINVNPVSLL